MVGLEYLSAPALGVHTAPVRSDAGAEGVRGVEVCPAVGQQVGGAGVGVVQAGLQTAGQRVALALAPPPAPPPLAGSEVGRGSSGVQRAGLVLAHPVPALLQEPVNCVHHCPAGDRVPGRAAVDWRARPTNTGTAPPRTAQQLVSPPLSRQMAAPRPLLLSRCLILHFYSEKQTLR